MPPKSTRNARWISRSRIKDLRTIANLTQEELAKKADLSPRRIQQIEGSPEERVNVQTDTLRKLAEVLGVSVTSLQATAPEPDLTVNAGTDGERMQSLKSVVRFLERKESVNLLVRGDVEWKTFIDGVCKAMRSSPFGDPITIDFESANTMRLRGFLQQILDGLAERTSHSARDTTCWRLSGNATDDLMTFSEILESVEYTVIVLLHFHYIKERVEYNIDFFRTLRNLTNTKRKLGLLAQTRQPFAELTPDDPMSRIDMKTVELTL